jgi:hypothetical protein
MNRTLFDVPAGVRACYSVRLPPRARGGRELSALSTPLHTTARARTRVDPPQSPRKRGEASLRTPALPAIPLRARRSPQCDLHKRTLFVFAVSSGPRLFGVCAPPARAWYEHEYEYEGLRASLPAHFSIVVRASLPAQDACMTPRRCGMIARWVRWLCIAAVSAISCSLVRS